MRTKFLECLIGAALVLGYLLLAGLVGNADADVEDATAETAAQFTVELVCLEGNDPRSAGTAQVVRPLLVTTTVQPGPMVLRCVLR